MPPSLLTASFPCRIVSCCLGLLLSRLCWIRTSVICHRTARPPPRYEGMFCRPGLWSASAAMRRSFASSSEMKGHLIPCCNPLGGQRRSFLDRLPFLLLQRGSWLFCSALVSFVLDNACVKPGEAKKTDPARRRDIRPWLYEIIPSPISSVSRSKRKEKPNRIAERKGNKGGKLT